MPRIMLVYPDGQTTYGQFDTDEQGPHFILGKVRYTIDDIAKSGAIAAVNSPEMLCTFQELGMPARPTARQSTITISVAADTRERLKGASKATGRSVSNILEEIAIDWLEKIICDPVPRRAPAGYFFAHFFKNNSNF